MNFLQITGANIAQPTEMDYSYEILDKTERTMNGTLVVDIIGKKRRLDVTWEYLSKEDMRLLAAVVQSTEFANISFNQPNSDALVSMMARAQDFTYTPQYDWAHSKIIWKSVHVCFIER